MRFRPIASLSVAAAAVLLLAGCTGSSEQAPTADASASADPAQCQTPFTGEVPAGLEVAGDFQGPVTVTRPDGFAPTDIQRSTLIEGSGAEIQPGDLVKANYTVIDASTGSVELDSLQSDPAGMDMIVNAQQIFGAAVSCVPIGSRTVSTFPAGILGEGSPAYVLVADTIAELPLRADGTEVAPVDGMPTVTFADNGAPTITVPSTPAPTETRVENLRQGDGEVVNPGDTVIVQYTGVLYDGGTVFDSSWDKGAPAQFATTGVVPGFQKALEGQTVGSQVVAVIPPADGYGETGQGEIPANATLVFVVDILGVQHAAAAAQ
ncbi:FKBP-type peptidyl-prolyl cis-trans isomerase [Microbacterium sp. SORGH_AS_0344]|uniref:FKBP-type peptidyl-prolyl cis-trans isomerase n=1 Tax=Microbacterium sp. SORGH_AS_0344 TaxID=3041767 RepID=UPI0027845C2D|nr:FKBP-type peptidyl-prolyl cis-trans isomerase [Microbacterium sp. SORGH_AS_0344]MDQ1083424.1 FKBP-type peptidyl-prolyl cis-trans isomerase [Microbacterium sp. SORGH_AS_0344]